VKLPWNRKKVASTAAVVTVPSVLATLALVNPGFPLAQVDLNDGAVWLTSTSTLQVGRYNAQVEELNAGLVASSTEFPGPASTVGRTVPAPTNLFGTRQTDGTVVFTWTNPDEQDGDTYLWGVRTATGEPQLEIVDEPTVTVTPPAEGGEVCVEVSIVRADRRASTVPAEGCAA
jgi:hypothetical protein